MEKKSIGAFIAALRRANGMTQRELADRLNVSDKTVSRWERDDGVPDIALIPVIAEIFGVTCDELLRGERKPASAREEAAGNPTAKGERQRRYLIRASLSTYQIRTMIAAGVSCLGAIAAFICNFALLRAVLGFLLGMVFYAAGLICQMIFVNRAFLAVDGEETDAAETAAYKNRVLRLAACSAFLTLGLAGFTFPMVTVGPYLGLTAGSLGASGTVCAAVALAVCAVIWEAVKAGLIRKGVYTLNERELAVYRHNRRLKKRCVLVLAPVLLVTLLLHAVLTESYVLVRPLVFNDYESFVEFMGREPEIYGPQAPAPDNVVSPPEGSQEPEIVRTLEDENGNVVCEYVWRNSKVRSVRGTPHDGSALPVRVYTDNVYQAARERETWVNAGFLVLYALEAAVTFLVYFKKRQK